MVLSRSASSSCSSPLPADASAAVPVPEPAPKPVPAHEPVPAPVPAPMPVAEEDPDEEEDPEEFVPVVDLTQDDEEEVMHVEEDQAEDDQAEAAQEVPEDVSGAGPGAVPPPLPSAPQQPERWTVQYHHHRGNCYFSRVLRMLFQYLHIPVEIDYLGRQRTHLRYLEE